jgi:peptidylprolyl isomerase
MRKIGIFLIAVFVLLLIGGFVAFKLTGNMMENKNTTTTVKLETTKGDIVIQLYDNEMPITTGNFEKLVKQGFYNGVIFHRVIDGFMIQGGDPQGTGAGGPGYTIKDEFTQTSLDENLKGTVSMAKTSAPNSAGSQFFINLVDNNFLNGGYSVFGKVIEGMDVVDAIGKVETDANDKPLEDVKIIKAMII